MRKFSRLAITVLMVMVLGLAACSPATTTAVPSAPETAATEPGAMEATQPAAGDGSAAGTCVSVDTNQLMTAGQTLYTDQCASCHGEQGEGMGDFPALTGNAMVTGEDVVQLVTGYFAVDAHPKTLSQEDLSALLSYTRGSFGNTGTVICPEDIQIPVTP